MIKRPAFIRHWRELEAPVAPPLTGETFGFASEFAAASDLNHLRVAHLRLPPGMRAYPPVALRDDEAFFLVLEGAPDLWLDGELHALAKGDGVSLNAGTGIAHTFLNNSGSDVRLFVMSEAPRTVSRAHHPVDPRANENLMAAGRLWQNPPARKRGPHDGRVGSHANKRKKSRPDFVAHWQAILGKDENNTYPESSERHGIDATFGKRARFSRIGVHVELLPAGRRTSWPHAERDEEEFGFVVSGRIDCWTDGHIVPMLEGDFVGWASGTGTTHALINNSDKDVILVIGGEANRMKNAFFYPLHPRRNKEIGVLHWVDHPKHKFGPHDGLPDVLRETVHPRARRDAVAANAYAAYGAAQSKRGRTRTRSKSEVSRRTRK